MITTSIYNVLFIIPQLFLPPAHPMWLSSSHQQFFNSRCQISPCTGHQGCNVLLSLLSNQPPFHQRCPVHRPSQPAITQPGLNPRHRASALSSLFRSGIWETLFAFLLLNNWSYSKIHLSTDNSLSRAKLRPQSWIFNFSIFIPIGHLKVSMANMASFISRATGIHFKGCRCNSAMRCQPSMYEGPGMVPKTSKQN